MEQPSTDRPRLTLTTNILYGVGSTAFGVHLTALSALLLLFFNQVIGLPAGLVGMAMMVTLIFDAICDPMIGEWSDHTRSSWGRRHPFMYASALPIAVAFYFLWNPPHGWSHEGMFIYLVVLLVMVRLMLSLYEVPSAALAPELTVDYDQRTNLMAWRFFFGAIGGAGMAILAYQVFLRQDATHPLGLMNRAGYGQFGLVCAIVMFVTIMISCLGTHRFIAGLVHAPRQISSWTETARELIATLSNRSFLALMISGIIGSVGMGLNTTLDLYINNYFWEFTTKQLSYFAGMFLMSSFLAVALAPAVSKRFGKKRSMIGVFVLSFFASAIPIPSRLLGLMPPNHSTALLMVMLGFTLVVVTLGIMGFIIVTSMMADVTEDIAVETGQRSEGLLFAANGLLQKCVTGVGTFLSGSLLQFVHFPQNAIQGHVDPLILRHLVLLYVPISASCSLISIGVLLFYRIDRNVHQQNVDRLNDRVAAAEVAESAEAYQGVAPVSRAL
ncbi:MAG TPA: MFS transporter [Candidatus Binataceae bacterium]|nr:MFS transporter [Candidatus Binataceae bacterium]